MPCIEVGEIRGRFASSAILIEAINGSARAFNRRHEFIDLPDHPTRPFLARSTPGKLFRR